MLARPPRADRFTRFVYMIWTVAAIILLTVTIRAVMALGVFASVTPTSPGICNVVAMDGPGDLAFDAKSHMLFVAAHDGLYALRAGDNKPQKLAGTPKAFHPTALSLGYGLDGTSTLWVVDRKPDGRVAVESYAVKYDGGVPQLSSITAIEGGLAARAQGIAALGDMRFYLAADPAKNDLLAWADRFFLVPRANVLFFNGMLFRPSINGLSDPSGVALSPDSKHLYVTSRNERRLIAFTLDPLSGTLQEAGAIILPMRPDRVSVDEKGVVWVAGPARLPALSNGKPASSVVVRIAIGGDGKPQNVETVYADQGEGLSAAGAAVHAEGHLFIGSALDKKLLDCAVK